MKKIIVLLIMCISVVISHRAEAQWTGLVFGDVNKKSAELSSLESATIKWEKTEYDLGEIKKNNPKKIEFKFVNNGKKPVLITKAEASCGCTKLEYAKSPVLPGNTGIISTVFDAKEEGSFQKSVTVYVDIDAPANVYELKLKGTVVK